MHSIPFGKSAGASVSVQDMQYKGLADPLVCGVIKLPHSCLCLPQTEPAFSWLIHPLVNSELQLEFLTVVAEN